MQDIVKIMTDERKRQGLSLRRLEKLTGVSYMTIHGWEVGRQEPMLDKFMKVMDVLGYELRKKGEA